MRYTLLILISAAALAAIFISLDADPGRMLWRDFITDEGWWTAEARDRAIFGDWGLDEYNQGLTTPLASYTWLGFFNLIGVSLLSARLPSALAALLMVLALFIYTNRCRRTHEATGHLLPPLMAPLLLASAIPFAMHARIAMPEMLSLLFVTLAWLLLLMRQGTAVILVAGALLGAALSAKLSAVVTLPALAVCAVQSTRSRGTLIRPAIHFTLAAVVVWVLLRVPFSLHHANDVAVIEAFHRGENLPSSIVDLLANIAFFPWPSPLVMQVAPLLALAGFGAWQLGLNPRGKDPFSRALLMMLLTGLCLSLFNNPADRRFLIFLPPLAILAARGWRAVTEMETPLPVETGGIGTRRFAMAGAALTAAFVIPGRLAIWLGRGMSVSGRPLDDFQVRALAAIFFLATLIICLIHLGRNPRRVARWLAGAMIADWLLVVIEPFDFLIWAGLLDLTGHYEAERMWHESGGCWSVPWGVLTLLLLWIPLARGGVLPKVPWMRPLSKVSPWLVPVLGLLVLVPTWSAPTYTLRDAAAGLSGSLAGGEPVRVVMGAEAPALMIGTELQAIPLRDDFNRMWRENPPPGTRKIRLMIDCGRVVSDDWPAGSDTLEICTGTGSSDGGKPRFVFAVWE
jgi:hypothetical protein